jgi:putative transposase
MARPLSIEFAGALYHVTAPSNARANIDGNDDDRQRSLSLLKTALDRYDWYCHAYRWMLFKSSVTAYLFGYLTLPKL